MTRRCHGTYETIHSRVVSVARGLRADVEVHGQQQPIPCADAASCTIANTGAHAGPDTTANTHTHADPESESGTAPDSCEHGGPVDGDDRIRESADEARV